MGAHSLILSDVRTLFLLPPYSRRFPPLPAPWVPFCVEWLLCCDCDARPCPSSPVARACCDFAFSLLCFFPFHVKFLCELKDIFCFMIGNVWLLTHWKRKSPLCCFGD